MEIRTIHVVYICDNSYVLPTMVSINSIIKNCNSTHLYLIHVIAVDVYDAYVKCIESLQKDHVRISVITTSTSLLNIGKEHLYVSKAALYKFKIAELLSDVHKVLYIDGDTLILHDISELYETELTTYYAAVIKDMAAEYEEKRNEILQVDHYFNSGVMLLNLEIIRKEQIADWLIHEKTNDTLQKFMDQDAFNRVFNKNVLFVSPSYNMMMSNNARYSDSEVSGFYEISMSESKKLKINPHILHLTNVQKPWKTVQAPGYDKWIAYTRPEFVWIYIQERLTIEEQYVLRISTLENQVRSQQQQIEQLEKHCLTKRFVCKIKSIFHINTGGKQG